MNLPHKRHSQSPLQLILHFHMMWLDKRTSKILHFTHKSIPGWHCDLFFKGKIEEVDPDGLKKWLKNNKAIAPDI